MYDSVTPSHIPVDAMMVAGYVDLWSAADWASFPKAIKVRIARNVHESGDVLDVESGDATPAQAPAWVTRERARDGKDKTVYMSQSVWQAVRDAFKAQNVREPQYWTAAYSTPPNENIPAGAVAHQYINPPGSGGHYDISSVADFWPGIDQKQQEDIMLRVVVTGVGEWLLSGSMYVNVDPGSAASLAASGIPTWTIDQVQHDKLIAASAAVAPPKISGSGTIAGTFELS
jgi:hypothetical protein